MLDIGSHTLLIKINKNKTCKLININFIVSVNYNEHASWK